MQFSLLLSTLPILLTLTTAQNLSGEPPCASACLISAISKAGCAPTDVACQCDTTGKAAIEAVGASCLISACNPTDLVAAQSNGNALCGAWSSSVAAAASAGSMSITPTVSTTTVGSTSTSSSTAVVASSTATSTSIVVTPVSTSTSVVTGSSSASATSVVGAGGFSNSTTTTKAGTSAAGGGAGSSSSSSKASAVVTGAAMAVVDGMNGVGGLLVGAFVAVVAAL